MEKKVIENRLRNQTRISKNQFDFMPGKSTEAIYLLIRLIENFRQKKRDLYIVSINLEKAYDRIPKRLLWWTLKKKKVSSSYIEVIKNMYEKVITTVRTIRGDSKHFPITIGLHQGSALSPYLFALIINEVTKQIQEDVP